jgi:hypothetical protein
VINIYDNILLGLNLRLGFAALCTGNLQAALDARGFVGTFLPVTASPTLGFLAFVGGCLSSSWFLRFLTD